MANVKKRRQNWMHLRKILQVSLFQCKYFLRIHYKNVTTLQCNWNWNFIIYFRIILSTIILLSIFGTLLSISNQQFKIWSNKSTFFKLVKCFDIITNLKQLFRQTNKSKDQKIQVGPSLEFAHGIKAMMMFFIVGVHASAFYPSSIFSNINPFANLVCYFFPLSRDSTTFTTSCDALLVI